MGTSVSDRRRTIIACALLAVLVFTKILLRPMGGLDELWVYGVARGVAMGYVPYRDFTMATVPLFYFLFSIPLRVVRNLFMFRITSAALLFSFGFVYYRIASRMTDHLWGLIASLLLVSFMDYATYNALMVLLTLIIFILFQKFSVRNAVIIGVLSALAILSRQTSGVFLLIAMIVYMCVDKKLRKFILPYIAGLGSVMVLFAAYLLMTGSFSAFWDCCFFAIIGPGEKNTGIGRDGVMAYILIAAGLISSVALIKKNKERMDIDHLVFGLVLLTIGIPIFDMMHVYYAAAWFLIPVIKLMKKSVSETVLKIVIALMIVFVLFINVYELPGRTLDNRYKEFVLIPVSTSVLDYYEQLSAINSKYEAEGKRVVTLSCGSCIISMMNETYDPGYDMFLIGNTGTRSAVSVIEEEMENPDVIFVIADDYEDENWQNPRGVLSVIQDNCTPIERYDAFVWYESSSAGA